MIIPDAIISLNIHTFLLGSPTFDIPVLIDFSRVAMGRNLWFQLSLALVLWLSSCHENVNQRHPIFVQKKSISWKDHHLREIGQCLHPNNDVFTLKSWQLERKKGITNSTPIKSWPNSFAFPSRRSWKSLQFGQQLYCHSKYVLPVISTLEELLDFFWNCKYTAVTHWRFFLA